jgi:ABC-type multidrug transport system fused ATPase/permease subunit
MSDTVIRVENISKLYRLGEVGTGSLADDVNRWWHKVRGKEDPYLKIGEVNDRTKPAKQAVAGSGARVTGEEGPGAVAGSELLVTSENQSASGPATRNQSRATASETPPPLATAPTGASAPATSYSPLVTPKAPPSDWVYALKDVSFEVKRGELRTLGRSEKEISEKCLGATKVPDSGRRRHQCLGLIGHNGAGKTTLLKMLNGLIKPDAGSITMRGRVGALIALGAGFNPILTDRPFRREKPIDRQNKMFKRY